MNDPHVERLHYKIEHGGHVDYSKAAPLEEKQATFAICVDGKHAIAAPKEHYASVQEVRAFVDPFLRGWELDMALRYRPGALRFVYDRADVVDRSPRPGPITAHAMNVLAPLKSTVTVTTCVGFAKFPGPPTTRMERDIAVEIMLASYSPYLENRAQLGPAAYFCLTAIEERGGKVKKNRRAGGQHYSICMSVLNKIGNLTDNKGGLFARKAHGSLTEFTDKETRWLEEAMRLLIRRAAEVAYDPTGAHRKLTMSDLPALH